MFIVAFVNFKATNWDTCTSTYISLLFCFCIFAISCLGLLNYLVNWHYIVSLYHIIFRTVDFVSLDRLHVISFWLLLGTRPSGFCFEPFMSWMLFKRFRWIYFIKLLEFMTILFFNNSRQEIISGSYGTKRKLLLTTSWIFSSFLMFLLMQGKVQ